MKKVLMYGGAFDPPHLGHLRYFENAVRIINPDVSLIIPSQVSPHKVNGSRALAIRIAMCRIFRLEGRNVVISGIEKCKNKKKSYSVKTLRRLRKKYPGAEIFMMIGSDMVFYFKKWHAWRRILSLCTLVVGVRAGSDTEKMKEAADELVRCGAKIVFVPFEPVETSSSEIRSRLLSGEDCSDILAADTIEFVKKHKLYEGQI